MGKKSRRKRPGAPKREPTATTAAPTRTADMSGVPEEAQQVLATVRRVFPNGQINPLPTIGNPKTTTGDDVFRLDEAINRNVLEYEDLVE